MSLQVDGSAPIDEQERQLRFIETFFVEVIDFDANSSGNNDVTVKPVPGLPTLKIHLQKVADAAAFTAVADAAKSIVFDRIVFVDSMRQRVVGYRA